MSNNTQQTTGGVGFFGLLCLLFIGLKLGGVIDWDWVWVLSPIWIPFAIVLFILLVLAVGMALGVGRKR